ncbi:MAG: 3'-5' exoribonuclease [Lachnospiraceae bacterium]|nr:3'-5' exoribonuclease [Lachnospiraceae bacterium]
MTNSYVSIDLETTGLNPKTDKIIEIGAVKVKDGLMQETFSTLIHPGRKLEERVMELTGIDDTMLVDAPELSEVLPGLFEFLEDLPLLGHRVLFDFSFLKKAAVNQKLSFDKEGIDTLRIARRHLTGLEHKTLESLCAHYQIPHNAHRAMGDALATHQLYQILARDYYNEEGLFRPVKLVYQVKRDTPITKAQKERLYRLLEQHGMQLDVDVDSLSRSEADRTIDRIRSQTIIRK